MTKVISGGRNSEKTSGHTDGHTGVHSAATFTVRHRKAGPVTDGRTHTRTHAHTHTHIFAGKAYL